MQELSSVLNKVHLSDAVYFLRALPPNSVDIIFVDPAYQIPQNASSLEGNEVWGVDRCIGGFTEEKGLRELPRYHNGIVVQRAYQEWCLGWASEALRVLKPGGLILSFCSVKAIHRLTCAIEEAGFEIRDQWAYAYARGMPTGQRDLARDVARVNTGLAKLWEGWKNMVRPAYEPICVARKPLDGKVGENAENWGNVGGFNVGGTLDIAGRQITNILLMVDGLFEDYSKFFFNNKATKPDRDMKGLLTFAESCPSHIKTFMRQKLNRDFFTEEEVSDLSASKFYEHLGNEHPTVKSTMACQEILSRVAKPGAVVLDFFCGSGSGLVAAHRLGCSYIGVDNDPRSVLVSQARLFLENNS